MLFVQQVQPLTPIIVKVIEPPSKEISVADVLVGSFGITGLFLIGAALFGVLLGGVFILFRRWQDRREQQAPGDEAFQLTQPPRNRT